MIVLMPDTKIRTIVGANNIAYQIVAISISNTKATFKVVKVN